MNEVQNNNVTPRNIMLVVTTNKKHTDPLGIHLNPEGSKWEANIILSVLAVRIVALGNRVEGMLRMNLPKEALPLVVDMQTLAGAIRDIENWPFLNGQQYSFKYDNTIYNLNALEPNKVEEIERAKNFVPKSLKKDS